jgi:hypothetical protein
MNQGGVISEKVWRPGWRLEAAATQQAATEVATFIGWLEQRGFNDSAGVIREIAMQHGVRKTEAALRSAFTTIRRRVTG